MKWELVTPTEKIVACDPFVFPESPGFTVQLSPGRYPVVLSVAYFDDGDRRVAYAAVRISSGLGDGCYASYFGFDEKGNPMILVTDFGVFGDNEIAEALGRIRP